MRVRAARQGAGRLALTLLALAACTEGRFPSGPDGLRPTRVSLSISAQVAAEGRTMRVTASYARAAAPTVRIPMDSAVVTLVGTETQLPVQLDIAQCLADGGREQPPESNPDTPTCVLHLTLSLFNAANQLIESVAVPPLAVRPGQTAATPPVAVGTVVGSVVLAPDTLTLNALGRSSTLSAVVRDRQGQTLASLVRYVSLSPSVIRVDSLSGVVTAVDAGTALVVASSRDRADTARVTVRQVPATLTLAGVPGTIVIGDSGLVTATVTDSGGAVIPATRTRVTYESVNPTILAVQELGGRLQALGAGTTTLIATVGTLRVTLPVRVIPPSVLLDVGSSPSATGTQGTALTIPIVIDMAYAKGQSLASLQFEVTWDASKFTFVSGTGGAFGSSGSFLTNDTRAGTGSLGVSVFDTNGFSSGAPTIYTLTLMPTATVAGSVVATAVTVAGDANGVSIPPARFIIRPLTVTTP